MCDEALQKLSPDFEELYSHTGRPSIAPEMLLRALLLQPLYSIASERLLMEQLDYNLLFRWFVGLGMDAEVWDATVFTKNRERLIAGEVAQKFFAAVREQAERGGLLLDEHFTVDGTLIEARESAVANCCATRTSRRPIRRRDCSSAAGRPRRDPATWDMC
jgi:transposase